MKISVHPEAKVWVPSDADLRTITDFFGPKLPNGRLLLYPRRLTNQVTKKTYPEYAFRAVTIGNNSYVFVDPSETKESIAFLIGHELTHQLVDKNPDLVAAFADAKPIDLERAGDPFHEIDAEERFCDGISARLLGTRYDRTWWRKRLSQESFSGEEAGVFRFLR